MHNDTCESFQTLRRHAVLLRSLRSELQTEASLDKVNMWLFDAVHVALAFGDLALSETPPAPPAPTEDQLIALVNHLTGHLPTPPSDGVDPATYVQGGTRDAGRLRT